MRPVRFAAEIGEPIETDINRGWYTITIQGGPAEATECRLQLDIGRGFSEHHSIGVWQEGPAKLAIARLFKHVQRIQATCDKAELGAIPFEICVTPLSSFAIFGCRVAELLALIWYYIKGGGISSNQPDRVFRRYLRWRDMFSFPRHNAVHSVYDEWILRNEIITAPKAAKAVSFILLTLDDPASAGIIDDQFCATCAWRFPTNTAPALAELERLLEHHPAAWVLLVQPGYRLHSQAIAALREKIDTAQSLALVYGDYDWVDVTGRRFNPHFQFGSSFDRLMVEDYLGPVVAITGSALRATEPWLAEEWTTTRWNMVRRVAEKVGESGIAHIPRVLAHALPDTWNNERSGRPPEQKMPLQRARAPDLPCSSRPFVSIIIPTKDKVELLSQAVSSILNLSTWTHFEILIIDHESREQKTLDWLASISLRDNIRVQSYRGSFNFSDMNNRAAKVAKGELLGFLNNDVEILSSDWIEHLAGAALRNDIGCAGAMLLYPQGTVQHDGISLGIGGVAAHAQSGFSPTAANPNLAFACQRNVSAVTGACLFVKASLFEQLGGFDAEHLPVAFNDVDLCLRAMELGLRNIWLPEAKLIHHESATRQPDNMAASDFRFMWEYDYMRKRWGHVLDNDRYYSANFDLRRPGLAIRL